MFNCKFSMSSILWKIKLLNVSYLCTFKKLEVNKPAWKWVSSLGYEIIDDLILLHHSQCFIFPKVLQWTCITLIMRENYFWKKKQYFSKVLCIILLISMSFINNSKKTNKHDIIKKSNDRKSYWRCINHDTSEVL